MEDPLPVNQLSILQAVDGFSLHARSNRTERSGLPDRSTRLHSGQGTRQRRCSGFVAARGAGQTSSAWAKYALAKRRVSFALRSSRFSRSRASLMRSRSSVV